MIRFCLIAIALVLSSAVIPSVSAQDGGGEFRVPTVIKISPSAMLQGQNRSADALVEFAIANNLSLQFGLGYLIHSGIGESAISNPLDRVRARGEIRQYFDVFRKGSPEDDYVELYQAIELWHLNRNIPISQYFAGEEELSQGIFVQETYLDTFTVERRISGLNYKIGVQFVAQHFTVDFYAGLGMRYKNIRHTGRRDPTDPESIVEFLDLSTILYDEVDLITFSVPAGVRFGYSF